MTSLSMLGLTAPATSVLLSPPHTHARELYNDSERVPVVHDCGHSYRDTGNVSHFGDGFHTHVFPDNKHAYGQMPWMRMDGSSPTTSVLLSAAPHTGEHYNESERVPVVHDYGHSYRDTANVSHSRDGFQTQVFADNKHTYGQMPGIRVDLSATTAVPSAHYTSFQKVPAVGDHEPPYLYTVNVPHQGHRFKTQVFRDKKDIAKCQRCGWTCRMWNTFLTHRREYCPATTEEKANVSILKEIFPTLAPKPGEVQRFKDFCDLPPVGDSEPPYDYICHTINDQKETRFMTTLIFRRGTDFAVCYHCNKSYREWSFLSNHLRDTIWPGKYDDGFDDIKISKRRH